MLIFKTFDSTSKLDKKQYAHMKLWAMASVRNDQDTPFVECADKAQAEEAKCQGRTIVGITAIPVIVPVTKLDAENLESHKKVNVSGALTFKITPNESFREFVYSHGEKINSDQLIKEFAEGVVLNLDPYLTHVINTETIDQIRKHGVHAVTNKTLSDLAGELPGWCVVEKLQLAVDDRDTVSRYTNLVFEATEKKDQDKPDDDDDDTGIIETLTNTVKKDGIKAARDLPGTFSKLGRKFFVRLILALFAAWALRKIVFLLGGGSSFDRECKIDFQANGTESSNLQKYLLAENFRQEVKSKGEAFSDITIGGKAKHLKEEDAQTLSRWMESYVAARHGTLCFVKNDYNHPHGIPKILGWSKPSFECIVGMESKLKSDEFKIIVKNDYDQSVKRRLDDMVLTKGKAKDGVIEYKSLKLRLADLEILEQALQNDPSLKSKGVTVLRGASPNEIIVTVVNYTLNYQLDVEALDSNYVDEVKAAVKAALSRDVYFKNGESETMPLAISEVESLKKRLDIKELVSFEREEKEAGKTVRLVFELSEKERKRLEIRKLNKEQKISWWNNDEDGELKAVMASGQQLEKDVNAFKVPANAEDAEYRKLLEQLQLLITKQNDSVRELGTFRKKVSDYKKDMEGKILKHAEEDNKKLESLAALYGTLKNLLEALGNQLRAARWEANAHREIIRRREAIEKATKEYEQSLLAEQTTFGKEIPSSIQSGQTKQYYENQERLAQQWDAKCRETFKRIEDYRNTEIKETFMLENKNVTMDVKSYKARVNDVLNSWASMCAKAMSCTQDCRYRRIEMSFLERQTTFWKNVEALNSLERELKAVQSKMQTKRQEVAGMTYAEARQRQNEIQAWFNQEILAPRKNIMLQLRSLAAYFSALLPQDDWGTSLPYDNYLGVKLMNTPEVRLLNANAQAKVQALVDGQEKRFTTLNMGSKRNTMSALKNKAETLHGLAESLTYFEENDKLKKLLKL